MTLAELASVLGCRLDGPGEVDILRVTALDTARAGDLSFYSNPKYATARTRTRQR